MKVLFLAPEPFYQDRGTPIAVDLLLRVLSSRGDKVDLITYQEGEDHHYEHVKQHRIRSLPFVKQIPPGLSWKKVVCNILVFFKAIQLLRKNRYDCIHAVEESVFIALICKAFFGTPYVYDMDSSLPDQIVDRYPFLRMAKPMMGLLVSVAVRKAKIVVPMCDALAENVQRYGPEKVEVLSDISLLDAIDEEQESVSCLRKELGIEGLILMYVGNMEPYQGIDLLLESFALAKKKASEIDLVIIGGSPKHVSMYKTISRRFGIQKSAHFLGPKPLSKLASYLSQADILVSPRLQGTNTPMKIYSYLASGKAVVATALPTHLQVLDSSVAALSEPSPAAFSQAIVNLATNEKRRGDLGEAAVKLIEEKYSLRAYEARSNQLLDWLTVELDGANAGNP